MPYVTFSISDGESRYDLSERSLGFRWFFSFLLFTAFRQTSSRKTVYLFDEPAANLHTRAQAELLDNFAKIASGGNQIVYSTHSHHMINPNWLVHSYIIENLAVDYEKDDTFAFDVKPTNIRAQRYRSFVSQYPDRTTYFQPVIEQLQFINPALIGEAPYLIVEGITDFYALRFVRAIKGKDTSEIAIMPGTGSGSSGPLVSYLLGRGDRFLVLLDDHRAGKEAAVRYRENWLLGLQDVVTLGELDKQWIGKKLESFISIDTKAKIKSYMQLERSPNKKQIGFYLAEICASSSSDVDALSSDTLEALAEILSKCESLMQGKASKTSS